MSHQKGSAVGAVMIIVSIIVSISMLGLMMRTCTQNNARVRAAREDLNQFRQALNMYWIDYADYPGAMTLTNAPRVLVDHPNSNPYMELPDGKNFKSGSWHYEYIQADDKHPQAFVPARYEIRVVCLDHNSTVLVATPDNINELLLQKTTHW